MSNFVAETPKIKVLVRESFLTNDKLNNKLVEAYLVSVHCRYGRPIFFTAHIESGALWSMLPLHALLCDKYDTVDETAFADLTALQPYSCLEGPVQVIAPEYLRNYEMKVKVGGEIRPATYLFTIDYGGTGMAEDPEQYKSHNIVALDNGQIAALPNNFCLFVDEHFVGYDVEFPAYKRSDIFYLPGS